MTTNIELQAPSSSLRFIGDVHGKFQSYADLIRNVPNSIQVGDFGIGFGEEPPRDVMLQGDHRYFPGNHDNPELCAQDPLCISPGTMHQGVFCIGGAYSIDRWHRIEGRDWWPGEELSMDAFYQAMDRYEILKPTIVATHDCPSSVADHVMCFGAHQHERHSRTRQALEGFLGIHAPKLWIFGHWHHRVDVVLDGTRFVCLEELGVLDIEMDKI
jgi:Calcineurin-like phosphoesterase